MGFFANLVSLSSFISGTIFGVLVCVGVALQYLKKSDGPEEDNAKLRQRKELSTPNLPKSFDELVSPDDAAALKKMISFLDDFNAPLKSIGGYLKQIYMQRETGAKITKELLERKQKVMIEIGTVSRMEKEFYDNLAHLKEHTKTLKGVTTFLTDLSKAFASFSKDLNRLANTAKNNMYKGLKDLNIDTKEDMIVNNWWQALHVSLDYMSSDQDYLATQISEELLGLSTQIHDELTVIEKRLHNEGNKQLHNIKENLALYESKRRERDKYREKVRLQGNSATLTTQSPAEIAQRRVLKMKINDDHLTLQTNKLYTAQKEFFSLMPRIDADVQLTVLKSIVETHSQLLKLTEAFERQQESNRMISKRMKLQLTNAAASLMQMIRDEGNLLTPSAASQAAQEAGMGAPQLGAPVTSALVGGEGGGGSVEPEILAYEEALRAKMLESGVQGYELSLQKVLEGLMEHCQQFDFTYGQAQLPQGQAQSQKNSSTTSTGASTGSGSGTSGSAAQTTDDINTSPESRGELNMSKESTACLAATNPAILPLLPSRFGAAVGTETCVWFNSFSGRVYRDISHSNYFYNWFCAKLTHLLNKGPRPDYVDEFKVNDVQFGVLPPLLMNVQWSPPCKAASFNFPGYEGGSGKTKAKSSEGSSDKANSGGNGKSGSKQPSPGSSSRAFIYNSDSEGTDSDHDGAVPRAPRAASASTTSNSNANAAGASASSSGGAGTAGTGAGGASSKSRYRSPPPKADDSEFFAACTADMAFRSGIKFTISTKLWINWPRDRYASVPVILYLNLEEISGRIRFGVTRGHSFFSFVGDPLMRINVRNEVGKGAYKFKDFPQLSEFIVKKLRAYVHNKIVHPASHKFRLIWPRNWWPEGTQGEFMGDGEEPAKGTSNKFGPPPAAPTLQPNNTTTAASTGSSNAPVASTVSASQEGSDSAPPPVQRERSNSNSTKVAALTSAATAALAQAGATATHKVEELAEKIKAASAESGFGIASPGSSNANSSKDNVTGAANEGGNNSNSSSSSSRYMAMRSKVTNWMQNHSRRNSTSDVSEDHYHPMSRAAQQQQQQQQQSSAWNTSPSPSVSPTVTRSPGPVGVSVATSSGPPAGSSSNSPRRRPSENMQAVMASARQSNLFNSPTPSTTSAGISTTNSPRRTSLIIYDEDGVETTEEGPNNQSLTTGSVAKIALNAHDADEAHDHEFGMFDPAALHSLTALQQEVLKDNLAWDLEVKNVVNRYLESQRRASTVNTFSNTSSSLSGSNNEISAQAYHAAMRCLSVVPERHRSPNDLEGTTFASHANTHGQSGAKSDHSASGSGGSSMTTPSMHTPVHGASFGSPARRDNRSRSIVSIADSVEGNGIPRCKSFQSPDPKWFEPPTQTEKEEDSAENEPRVRSYSITDFRPEIQDAMFRIHILGAHLPDSHDAGERDTSTGEEKNTNHIQEDNSKLPSSGVASSLASIPTGRTRAHSLTGRTDNIAASTNSHSNSLQSFYPNEASSNQRRPLSRADSAYSMPRPSLQQRLSVVSSTTSGDLAHKFADFKAKHLNNRDLSEVVLGIKKTSGEDVRAGSPSGINNGNNNNSSRRPSDAEYRQHSLTSMREALDAEEEPAHSHNDHSSGTNHREGRASISGPSSGSGTSSTSSTLKYMSTMFRSKFGSGAAEGSEKSKSPS